MEFINKLAERRIRELEAKKELTAEEQGKLKAFRSNLENLNENFKTLMLKDNKTTKEWAEFKTYRNFKEILKN